jgi:hypothetical protein
VVRRFALDTRGGHATPRRYFKKAVVNSIRASERIINALLIHLFFKILTGIRKRLLLRLKKVVNAIRIIREVKSMLVLV